MKKLLAGLVLATCLVTPVQRADAHMVSRGRCPQYESLLRVHRMPVQTFSRIMYRESRCQPMAINRRSGARGLLQVMPAHAQGGRWHTCRQSLKSLTTAVGNIACAATLYRIAGTRPWATTR